MANTPGNAINVSTSGAVSFNGTAFTGGTLSIANGGSNATSFTQSNGIVTYNGTSLVNYAGPQIDSSGRMTNTTQPAFRYELQAQDSNVSGAGTVYQLGTNVTLTQIFDNGSNCTTAAVFTAPVTGIYNFSTGIHIANAGNNYTSSKVYFVVNSVNYYVSWENGKAITATNNATLVAGSQLIKMTASQTCVVKILIEGGTGDNINIGNNPVLVNSWFSGYLVC